MKIHNPFLFWLGAVFAFSGSLSLAMGMYAISILDTFSNANASVVSLVAGLVAVFGAFMLANGITPKE